MPVRQATVASRVGLHARPASLFVAEATKLGVPVTIQVGERPAVDARSMLAVMTLGAKCGDVVTVADFSDVKTVDVTGTSKGKGFQGTVKRWNFSRGPMAHGSRNQRRPGSIGQCAYPSRVRKGLHMYGHMGDDRVTVKNLKLVRIDAEQNLLLIKGAVPGGKNALVQVRMA